MSTLELFVATGTGPTLGAAGIARWPYLDGTGTWITVPEIECDPPRLSSKSFIATEALVRSIQDKLGLTIGQTAKALGCSRQAVHGWMRGKSVDPDNLANLRRLADWAVEWSGLHPDRSVDPDRLDAAALEKLGSLGISSPKARSLWERRVLRPTPSERGWDSFQDANEIARRIGAEPVSELERGHRRAHNLGSLKIDARL